MIREWIYKQARELYPTIEFDISIPPKGVAGDYALNAALLVGKQEGKNPKDVAAELREQLLKEGSDYFSSVEVVGPGFLNFTLKAEFLQGELRHISLDDSFGTLNTMKGKRVLVEYTDPNPFKQFHIGHLMTNMIGESLARLYEAAGAEVLRLNYQGDVGVHVACSVWGMQQLKDQFPNEAQSLSEKMKFLGRAYAHGAQAYKDNEAAKSVIDGINKKIYEKSDVDLHELYARGRQWSLDYFETIYARLGTKFNHYFFESEVGPDGLEIVRAHPEVFQESQGAVIFPGEQYGLHSRVFINALGLPTYEAKELGLNKKKFELFQPDLSLVVTANEINDYFRVLLKAMELVVPEVGAKTRHVGHGVLQLPTGKMSSRTGDVVTAESLIDEVKKVAAEKLAERPDLSDEERETIQEAVALAAIRYSIVRQEVGSDIIFDKQKSVTFHGDSGPYLQYTYARLVNILKKAGGVAPGGKLDLLEDQTELDLIRHFVELPHVIERSIELHTINTVALYTYELANRINRFYEACRILEDENSDRQAARILLVQTAARVLKQGLHLLGIKTLERI